MARAGTFSGVPAHPFGFGVDLDAVYRQFAPAGTTPVTVPGPPPIPTPPASGVPTPVPPPVTIPHIVLTPPATPVMQPRLGWDTNDPYSQLPRQQQELRDRQSPEGFDLARESRRPARPGDGAPDGIPDIFKGFDKGFGRGFGGG